MSADYIDIPRTPRLRRLDQDIGLGGTSAQITRHGRAVQPMRVTGREKPVTCVHPAACLSDAPQRRYMTGGRYVWVCRCMPERGGCGEEAVIGQPEA